MHNLKISVNKKAQNGGIVAYRRVTVREKLLRFLFGNPVRLTVIVPGNSVDSVSIEHVREGGEKNE